jgi:hypothetical protein
MIGTPAIRNLIRENKIAQMYSSIQTGQNVGMQTLDQCLTDLVRRNVVSAAEARCAPRTRTASRAERASRRVPPHRQPPTQTHLATRSKCRSTPRWNAIRHSNS